MLFMFNNGRSILPERRVDGNPGIKAHCNVAVSVTLDKSIENVKANLHHPVQPLMRDKLLSVKNQRQQDGAINRNAFTA